MANSFFRFKQFTVQQDACAMKVCTDACLFGGWCAAEIEHVTTPAKTLLDAGTGTGLLSLMVRQKNNVLIDAVEIDETAAAQAHENVQASPWPQAIRVLHQNVLDMRFSKSYDYIISNPPFYENDLQSNDPKRNTAHHSNRLILPRLFQLISKRLKTDGAFFLLLPFKRRAELKKLLDETGLFLHNEVLVHQTETHAPFRVMWKGGIERKETETMALAITTPDQSYTPPFAKLLHDYYLYL